jgi:CBS domain-containing protein
MNKSSGVSQKGDQEKRAILLAFLFLAAGFVILWFAKAVLKIEGEAILIALLLTPLLVYLILSGKLEEFKGPGGLEAKFAKVAGETISTASEEVRLSVEEMQIVEKEGLMLLERKRQELNEAQPIVMIMELGKRSFYKREAVQKYLDVLSQFRNFKFVVFVDSGKRFAAYMPSWSLKNLLSINELGDWFINVVNDGRAQELFRYPGVVRETIHTQSTNTEALREMTKQNSDALVVIDEKNELAGVVEREQILSRMMLSLAR